MSEEDGSFLTRWSRRKAAAARAAPPETPDPPPPELPPIESLGADSDYTMFLARGVSRAVQAQALGIAWATDPAIANFRGMAEYAWDFNAPGYGALAPGDDGAAWLSQIVRSGAKLVTDLEPPLLAAASGSPPPAGGRGRGEGAKAAEPDSLRVQVALTPTLPREERERETLSEIGAEPAAPAEPSPTPPPRRRHGGAVPV